MKSSGLQMESGNIGGAGFTVGRMEMAQLDSLASRQGLNLASNMGSCYSQQLLHLLCHNTHPESEVFFVCSFFEIKKYPSETFTTEHVPWGSAECLIFFT